MTCSGPNFGTSGGYDLQVWCESYEPSSSSYLSLSHGFKRAITVNRVEYSVFGRSPFYINELEVFEVKF